MSADEVGVAHASLSQAAVGFYPQIGLTEDFTYGNDPVYVFGSLLRQNRFTSANFALSELNAPAAIGNYATKLQGKWNLFNSFGDVSKTRSAKLAETASKQTLKYEDQILIKEVVDAYCAWLLAIKETDLARIREMASEELERNSSSRVDAGTAVDSDSLSAKVDFAMRQQDVIKARGATAIARMKLETALGASLPLGQLPTEVLKEDVYPAIVLEEAETAALRQRSDLRAMASQIAAQNEHIRATKAEYGPSLNAMGSFEVDNPSFASGGNTNWIVGAELRINVFSKETSTTLALDRAKLRYAEAARRSAENTVRLQVAQAFYAYDTAHQMLEVSKQSIGQAQESLRITRDRYESGVSTLTDMLRVVDAERSSETNYWQALYEYRLSYAALQLAVGDLSPQSQVVTQ